MAGAFGRELATPVSPEDEEEVTTIFSLPHCVLEHILLKLDARDIVNFASCCSESKGASLTETLWAGYARLKWGGVTDVDRWIASHPQGIFQWQGGSLASPGTYQ